MSLKTLYALRQYLEAARKPRQQLVVIFVPTCFKKCTDVKKRGLAWNLGFSKFAYCFKKQTNPSLHRHVSIKIPIDLPQVLEKISYELGKQRDRFRLSLESPVDDFLQTLDRFNKQFQLKEPEREAVTWA